MAYMGMKPGGQRYVQVDARDGRKKTIGLGSIGRRKAEQVRQRIEDLAAAVRTGTTPDPATRQWLASVDGKLRRRLVALGLAEPGTAEAELSTLGPFLNVCLDRKRASVKASTMDQLEQARDCLLSFFDRDRSLPGITEAEAEDYQRWLRHEAPRRRQDGKGFAAATVGKRCKIARECFAYAVRQRLIQVNPFDAIKCASPATEHHAYINAADAEVVLRELPDAGWRLLFALARWGGLRVISEPRVLTWADVDWECGRLRVPSPKTEHLPGHGHRIIPLFPELVGPLREVFELAEPGDVLVLPWLSDRTAAALRKPVQRAIERARVKPWPRLWHNLRSSRQTELERRHPNHVVCAWLGNSQAVAAKHYLQVTDDDFAAATRIPEQSAAHSAGNMHGHAWSAETKTALVGSGRVMVGHELALNRPSGI